MHIDLPVQQLERAFAKLGRELSATTNAESAAKIIVEVANELIGWDACYLILYDPAQGGKLRPVLNMDTINGVRTMLSISVPDKPSVNMQRAIAEDGFLSLHGAPVEVDRGYSFGGNRRTLSHLFAPVRSGERTIGVFSIQSYTKSAYDKKSLEIFKALANQCAGALERIWAQEALAEVEARRALIYNATHAINASLELEQLYEIIYQTVLGLMPCDDFIISAYDGKNNEIEPLFIVEKQARLTASRYRADHGLAAHIVHTGESRLFNNDEELNASGVDFIVFTQTRDSTQSILAVPMMLYGKVTGMISAQSYEPNAYTTDDQNLLELLATHAAVAIENARLFARIQQLADMDSLTGVYTRRKFYEIAEKEFAHSRRDNTPLSLIMLDVDEFKKFNDTFGHKVGDFVLQIAAEQCKSSVRGVDTLARHGGEEFIILLPGTELEDAILVAKRLRECVELADLDSAKKFLELATGSSATLDSLRVTVSLGIAALDKSCANIDILVDHADRAMYAAKNSGRNKVVVWGQLP
jgi:diguanylate cyclase (GGDEF)-like protein